jgi:SSS family transporter
LETLIWPHFLGDFMQGAFSSLDWIVLIVYLAASILIGASFYRKHESGRDFFLAGRSMSWFPIAISIIATDLSALSYMGVPALVYQQDLKYTLGAFLLPLQMALVIAIFVPLFYRLNLYTVYEYLERRFNFALRLFASLLFMGGRGAWMATATFATGLALAEITGMSTTQAIIICGLSTTVYTFLGGMEAVIWTDFLQFFVLVGGAIAIMVLILIGYGGDVGHIWDVASAAGHTQMFDTSFDLTRPYTVWGIFIGLLVFQLSSYATDQVIVQRYFTTKSLKDTIWAVMGASIIVLPVLLLLYAIGIGFVAYYQEHPEVRATLSSADRVMPHFTLHVIPAGFRGLVIAGVFAATMSSISAGINSLTTSTMKDLLERYSSSVRDHELFWARLLSILWGCVATVGALLLVGWKLTIIEKFTTIYQFFAGPLVGIFLLGVITKRASSLPVLLSAIVGFAATMASAGLTQIHWLWYAPVGCLVTLILGYITSILSPRQHGSDVEKYTLMGSKNLTDETTE